VLAIDTSHPEGSVCLSAGTFGRRGESFGHGASHLVEIGRSVDRVFRGAELGPGDLSRIALVAGPGSFTGLRVGMSYAKGLAAALDVDFVTIGTLELLARPLLLPDPGAPRDGAAAADRPVCVLVDARKGEVYTAVYARDGEGLKTLEAPSARSPGDVLARAEDLDPVYVGSGTVRYREAVEGACRGRDRIAAPRFARPSTEYLCAIAPELAPLSREAVLALEPTYIRSSDAVLKTLRPVDPHEKSVD
jgi:tRNA threonylcarbamoyladenosine biosynthesis protein TsaB